MEDRGGEGGGIEGRVEVRVRYGETDTAGVVYHANYLQYFEIGRTELMRTALGIPYRSIEDQGVQLTVVEMQARFQGPARYDDVLRIETRVAATSGARVRFEYRVVHGDTGELLCTGSTLLGSLDSVTGRACRLPERLRAALSGTGRSR